MRRAVERAVDRPFVVLEHAEAVAQRERRRRHGAEIAGGHRAGIRDAARSRECRKLKRGEIGVSHPALPGARERREVDAVDQAADAVAAAQHDGNVGLRIGRNALERGETLVVRRRESLPSSARRRIALHAMAEACKQRFRAVDGGSVRGETRRRHDRDVEACAHPVARCLRAVKNRVRSRAHSSAATPAVTRVW